MLGTNDEKIVHIVSNKVVPADVLTQHGHLRSHLRVVSQQCVDDTVALLETPELDSAQTAWNEDYGQDDRCVENTVTSTYECTYDSKTYSSHDTYLSVCAQVGGTPYLVSGSFTCGVTGMDSDFDLVVSFVDFPWCIASTCGDAVEFAEVIGTRYTSQWADAQEESLISEFGNAQCTASQDVSAVPASSPDTSTAPASPTDPPATVSDPPIGGTSSAPVSPTDPVPDMDQCIADKNALYNTTELSSAKAAWRAEFNQKSEF